MEILFFPNGNTAVLEDGAQVPSLQHPWVLLFAKFLEERGVDPLSVTLRFPNGMTAQFVEQGEGGYNWRFKEKTN